MHHLISTILIEDDNVVHVGAIGYKFILLQRCTNEAIFTINVKFFVSFGHL